MNGTGPEIQIFKPFGEAFELMKKILFRPFDLKKWFVIGFAAWLSNLGSGGSYNSRFNRDDWKDIPWLQDVNDTISQIPHWILWSGLAVIIVLVVALMYRRRCRAGEAFRAALSLIASYPGEITFYCLFWIMLGIASAVVACATILATCCIALLPYIGTVILLPLFVCLRAFGLRFIRQFGPDYDVWIAIPEPRATTTSEPPPLPS